MSVVGLHSWPPVRSVPRTHARGREFPDAGEPLGGGQSVGEVVTGWVGKSATVHPSSYTCSRTTPNARDNVSFNRFASFRERGDTDRQVRLVESPPPIPSVGPVVRTWRIGRTMEPSAGSLLEDPSQSSRDFLHPSGALDRSGSRVLREAISRSLSRGPATLVVDLSDVRDVDAAGLDVLVYACRASTAAHVKLVLCSLPPLVLELLEPTRLSDLGDVDIEPTMPVPLHTSAA